MKTARFIRQFRSFAANERGAIVVEFALISTALLTMLLGLFQFAAWIHQTMQLNQAARAGVEYAMTYPSDTAGIQQTVINSSVMNASGLTVTVAQFCECPDGTPVACDGTCASGLQGNAYIRLQLSQPARGPLQSSGFLAAATASSAATMRVR